MVFFCYITYMMINNNKQTEDKNMIELNIGETVTYTKQYAFGKSETITATVVAICYNEALLDNGDQIFKFVNK